MSEISSTADRVLAVLSELADGQPATPQRLAAKLGLNRTVTQRLLATLLSRQYVVAQDGQYRLAPRIHQLADRTFARLRRTVTPTVTSLSARSGETVVFQVPDGRDVVVLIESVRRDPVSVQVRQEVGSKTPMTRSASGLVILAASSPTLTTRLLAGEPDPDRLRAQLEDIRRTGVAVTHGGVQAGVSGMATAVASHGQLYGALAVLVPSTRAGRLDALRSELLRRAGRLESALR